MDDSHNPHLSDYITRSSIQSPGFDTTPFTPKAEENDTSHRHDRRNLHFHLGRLRERLAIGTMAN